MPLQWRHERPAKPVKFLQSVDISVEKLNWSTKFQLNGASMRRSVPLRLLDMIPAPQASAGICTIEKLHILNKYQEGTKNTFVSPHVPIGLT